MIMEFPKQGQANKNAVRKDTNRNSQTKSVSDEKVREMKDQLIRAKAYLNFAAPNNNSYMVKESKLRIKWIEQTLREATKDSELSRSTNYLPLAGSLKHYLKLEECSSVMQRMKSKEGTLYKASQIYANCSAMATKLCAMTKNAEGQFRAHKNQVTYLVQLASRTTPKGLHCLSMRLTIDYFARSPEEQELPNKRKLYDPDIYHFTVFFDNILACAVVVNSTISSSVVGNLS
ncbi:hypothetical protein GIB67_028266 [Kingdonia uniflora]|uniref:Uncharacterized protein n=1 Tax=Kingdonia uniflora TaxID=39325 RepID=A0A7J7KZ95_9MAGN|nr:hypothetical protein GIB67_028266 [Kingdonia uniflora]